MKISHFITSFGKFLLKVGIGLVMIFVLLNIVIAVMGLDKKATWLGDTLKDTQYSPEFISWDYPYCQRNFSDCDFPEETVLPQRVEVDVPQIQQSCNASFLKVLFIGSDMTATTTQEDFTAYTSFFGQDLAQDQQRCVKLYRLTSYGVGTDQELLALQHTVSQLQPNIVVWQFSFNDIYADNARAIFTIQGNHLVRRNTFTNTLFLTAFINQKVPGLRFTPLGKYLLYLGETRDLFHNQVFPDTQMTQIQNFGMQKIAFAVEHTQELAQKYHFSFYTTQAPLECSFNSNVVCQDGNVIRFYSMLQQLLAKQSTYLALDPQHLSPSSHCSLDAAQPDYLFDATQSGYLSGSRPLSAAGHACFGTELFKAFKSVQ